MRMKINKRKLGYKFIQSDMESQNGNHKWVVGKWYTHNGKIGICEAGFHACKKPLESLGYVYGDKWFIVEYDGKVIHEKGDKFVSENMRLVKEIPVDVVVKPFAIWCAKQCLKNYESEYPNDKRVFEAIRSAELYLDGKITLEELSAARTAARAAARTAAGSAAWSAWSAARTAAGSAWSAARTAAESARTAARTAAESAARAAARPAQNHQLKKLINNVVMLYH